MGFLTRTGAEPRRTPRHRPVSLKILAAELPAAAWHAVTWRAGTRGAMRSRFARVRVRPAHRDQLRSEPRPEEGLLIEWPRREPEPTKYWLATLPETMPRSELVRLAKLRWRIERDYKELKDELGLDRFEGRGWRGFHHHGALSTAAYAFLAAERARFPAGASGLPPTRSPSQRFHAAGRSRCGLNGMSPRRSPRSTSRSPESCFAGGPADRVAASLGGVDASDRVVLTLRPNASASLAGPARVSAPVLYIPGAPN